MNRRILGFLGIIAAVCMTAAARGQAMPPQDSSATRADNNTDVSGGRYFFVTSGLNYTPSGTTDGSLSASKVVCADWMKSFDVHDFCAVVDYSDDFITREKAGTKLTGYDARGFPVAPMTLGGTATLSGCDGVDGRSVIADKAATDKMLAQIRFAGNFPLFPAANVRAPTADESNRAWAFILEIGKQMGIPRSVLAKAESGETKNLPYDGIVLSFVDFNRDGLPDLVGTFYVDGYSLLVVARNTGSGFAAEYQRDDKTLKDLPEDDPYGGAPPVLSWYGSFNVGDRDDLIVILDETSGVGTEGLTFMRRDAKGHWREAGYGVLATGCD